MLSSSSHRTGGGSLCSLWKLRHAQLDVMDYSIDGQEEKLEIKKVQENCCVKCIVISDEIREEYCMAERQWQLTLLLYRYNPINVLL